MGFKARAQKIRLSVSVQGATPNLGPLLFLLTTQPCRSRAGVPVRMGRKERGDQNKVLFRAAGASLARCLPWSERRLAAKVSLGKCQVLQKREESRAETREERESDAPLPPPARLPFPMRIYVHVRSPRVCRVFPLFLFHLPVNICIGTLPLVLRIHIF